MQQFRNKSLLLITIFLMGASVHAETDSLDTVKGDEMTSTATDQPDSLGTVKGDEMTSTTTDQPDSLDTVKGNEMTSTTTDQPDSQSTVKGDEMTSTTTDQPDSVFLTQISTEEGVVTTESGLRYKVLVAGKGAIPTKDSTVSVNYEGRLVNGSVFDSSYQRGVPAHFGVSDVIAGWTEALQLMNVGSTWELYIPADLAYGQQGVPGVIPPNAVLVFKVELLEVS